MNAFAVRDGKAAFTYRFNYAALFLGTTADSVLATLFRATRVKQLVFFLREARATYYRIKQNRLKTAGRRSAKGQSFKVKILHYRCLTLGGIAYLVSYGSFNGYGDNWNHYCG